jgi:hypothetical protein
MSVCPPMFVRKKKASEQVELLEIPRTSHFDLIDPDSRAFGDVLRAVLTGVQP